MPSPVRSAAVLLAALLPGLASPLWAQHVSSVQVMPSDATVKVGDQAPFVASAYDAGGNPIVSVTFRWYSSDHAVATIDAEGIATAHAPGKATITVRTGTGRSERSAHVTLEVAGGAVAAPAAAPAAATPPANAAAGAPGPAATPPSNAAAGAPSPAATPPARNEPTPPVAAQAATGARAPERQPPSELVTLRYAPGSLHYRIQGTAHEVRVDQAGTSHALEGTLTVLLSAAFQGHGDSLVGELTLDSVAATGTASLPEDFLTAKGRTFRAVFSTAGRSLGIVAPDTANAQLVSVSRTLRAFLTLLPARPFAAPYAWADTLVTDYPWLGGTLSNESSRRHMITGWESQGGERALHVVVTSANVQTGRSGRGPWGDPVDLHGTERDTADAWVSAAGVMLGETASTDGQYTVSGTGGRALQRSRTLASWTVMRLKEGIVARVTLAPGEASLRIGDKLPFLATVYDSTLSAMADAPLAWSSSAPGIVTVDQSGIATGASPGLAIVRVRAGTGAAVATAEAPVQVTAAAPAAAAPAPLPAAPAAPLLAAPAPAALGHADSLSRGCEGGNAAACTDLGLLYSQGRGVTQDLTRAGVLYRRACDAGNAPGCTYLGNMYNNGTGVAQNFVQARALYERGCSGGNVIGCNNLGFMFEHGTGGPMDLAQARTLYLRACDGGDMVSCSNLGLFFQNGRGGAPTDYQQARTLYQRACDGGAPRGCTNLGVLYERGLGVSRDAAQARTYFQRGCSGGDQDGCNYLQKAGGTGIK